MIFFFWWHHQVLLFFNSAPRHLFTYTFQSTSEAHTYRKHANRDSTPKQAPPPQLDCLINSRTVFPLLVLLTLTLRMIWDPPEAVLFPEVSNTLSPSRLTRRPIIFYVQPWYTSNPLKRRAPAHKGWSFPGNAQFCYEQAGGPTVGSCQLILM